MRRFLTNHRLIVVFSILLAMVGVVFFIVPVTAEGPAAAIEVADPAWHTVPVSRPYPYPYPHPGYPISRTIRISGTVVIWPYPYPYWCVFPTAVAPPPPPGLPTPVPPTPYPSPTPGGPATAAKYEVCPQIINKVPNQVQADALAQPWTIYGYNMRLNPNVPAHPMWNPLRAQLTVLDYNKPYNLCNPVVWKAGCP